MKSCKKKKKKKKKEKRKKEEWELLKKKKDCKVLLKMLLFKPEKKFLRWIREDGWRINDTKTAVSRRNEWKLKSSKKFRYSNIYIYLYVQIYLLLSRLYSLSHLIVYKKLSEHKQFTFSFWFYYFKKKKKFAQFFHSSFF